MSKTIAINAGSSSLKWQLYTMPEETVVAKGIVERIGMNDSIFTIKYGEGEKYEVVIDIPDHEVAVKMLLDQLIDLKILASYDEITGVGHRVVHGGEYFDRSVVVTDDVMAKIEELFDFAPLHNPANLMGIKAFKHLLPDIISVAVFDTAFHATMPKPAYLYSLPIEYYNDYKVRKYGAHGTSHRYVSERAAEMLEKPIEELKIITCHLGNGGSITAVNGGHSVDTSMGFTPLAGITMGTRSGDLDAAILPYLMGKLDIDIDEMVSILNKKSGLLGLTGGLSSDMRDLQDNKDKEDVRVALEVFYDRVRKYIGSYVAAMNGVDAIVFTAGIGENSAIVRSEIMNGLTWFGAELDPEQNAKFGDHIISTEDSKVKVLLIPTDEELMIARDVEALR
ncbi:acetate/propionate family kinase [uncultured Enterococcus sp.]|uniref:acetate/propionate family kinase n=1 Tax=uncultured Enterococcus sp. TaxID=167972 RepID=UPI0025F819B1|nr:acetate kinase [uncultured Enterococcus sp.]